MSYISVGGDDRWTDAPSPEHIKEIPEDILLEIFEDEKCPMKIRFQAVYALFNRQSPLLVSPLLKFLNSVIDSDSDMDFEIADNLRHCIGSRKQTHTGNLSMSQQV